MFGLCDESLGNLDPPLLFGLVDAQDGQSHDGDDDAGNEVEDTLPKIFGFRPNIMAETVEDANEGAADDQGDADARE